MPPRNRTWLDYFFGPWILRHNGVDYPERPTLEMVAGSGVTITPADDVYGQATKVTFTADGSATVVQDDVAKSLGTGGSNPIDRVRGHNGVAFKNDIEGSDIVDGTAPPYGGAWTAIRRNSGEEDVMHFAPDNPVPRGWYDPRHYGAKFDGQTDDYPAFVDMLADMPSGGGYVHVPPGFSYIGQTLFISKPAWFVGLGGNESGSSGFQFAPGIIGLQFDGGSVSADGGSSNYSAIKRVNMKSRMFMHPTVHGNTLGTALPVFGGSMLVRKGECVVRASEASPTRCYRAITLPANGRDPVQLSGAPTPSWSDTIGSTVTSSGITWQTESLPLVRVANQAYVLGERVYAPDDNRYVFTCTTAGSTANSATGVWAGGPALSGITVGGMVTDGSVTWTVSMFCGAYVNSNFGIFEGIYGTQITSCILHVQGGDGQDARGITDANNTRIRDINGYFRGMGVYLGGDNCNGWTADAVNTLHMGTMHPGVAGSQTLTFPYPAGARGGHTIVEVTLGGTVKDSYSQLATGRPLVKNGNGRVTAISCYQELSSDQRPYFNNIGPLTVIGGNYSFDPGFGNLTWLDPQFGYGLVSRDDLSSTTAKRVAFQMGLQDGCSGFAFSKPYSGDAGVWAMVLEQYSYPGFWAQQYGRSQVIQNAYLLSNADSYPGPGPGWLIYPNGFLIGPPGSEPVVRGHVNLLKGTGAVGTVTSQLRQGRRVAGDQFTDGSITYVVTCGGYVGDAWTPNPTGNTTVQNARAGSTTTGLAASMVVPTTNTGTSAGGEKVFQCTTSGIKGGTEPNWSTATTVGNTVTDGSAVWTLVGFTPAYETHKGAAQHLQVDDFTTETSTTTASSGQTIATYVVESALSGVTTVMVDYFVVGGGSAGRGSAKISATFTVSNTGAITRVGTDDTAVKGMNGATFAIDIATANTIKLTVTPGSAVTNTWRTAAQAVKGTNT